jgi:hypothetical protein
MNDPRVFDPYRARMAEVMRDIRFLGYCHGGVHLWRFPERCVSLQRVSRGTWTPGRLFDAEFHALCPIDSAQCERIHHNSRGDSKCSQIRKTVQLRTQIRLRFEQTSRISVEPVAKAGKQDQTARQSKRTGAVPFSGGKQDSEESQCKIAESE